MFLAASEGYFDKIRDQSELIRLQTFLIVQASGAKTKGGSEVRLTDLWLLPGEQKQDVVKIVWGTDEERKEWFKKIEKMHNIKLS